jgi:hypothetical protein
MKPIVRMPRLSLVVLVSACLVYFPSQAHLMVAQSGTLNVKNDAVFMVLSLPVSAFAGTDDNGDGFLSDEEFSRHRNEMVDLVEEGVALIAGDSRKPLRGTLLSPVFGHGGPKNTASQLVVMGRFSLGGISGDLKFTANLFGTGAEEQSLEIVATRSETDQRNLLSLTPEKTIVPLF